MAQAQYEIDSREFAGWMAFSQLEPFGSEMEDLRAGIIASTVANVFGGKGTRHKPRDYMPDFDKRKRHMTALEMMAALRAGCKIIGE